MSDTVQPAIARVITSAKGGKSSNLLFADEERLMQDRMWRFFRSPHAVDWSFRGRIAIDRKALLTGEAFETDVDRYFNYLRKKNYRSSHTRYRAIEADAASDIAALPGVFDAICAVQELDRRRMAAGEAFDELDQEYRDDVALRKFENEANVEMFARVLEFRFESYTYALKRLLLDTPHAEAQSVDARLSELAIAVATAAEGTFCLTSQFRNPAITLTSDVAR